MSTVTESVDVHVPVRTAYNQWTQFESFPHFMKGVESVRQIDETHSRWVVDVAGAVREFDTEITEQHPDERIAWKSVGGEMHHAGVVTFQRLSDDETRVTVQLDWEPEGFVENLGSAIGVDSRQVKADVEGFKEFIEDLGHETGAWRGEIDAPGAHRA
ncbi:SRPBCC family protein [Catellatospora citrea]|uniref:Cyclase n=1 Tax=Catellatospora citrea TaxID=53366 RepID=A0A8J3KLM9_9ACTN|nr:SRPBCC family protein [Catellatospora citrea]RKE00323.1 polyketide cyclase/dehydrase/lipid transport protein [Catellatospora citrea]GIF99468.1 cyclase [Catellatospora citrea]